MIQPGLSSILPHADDGPGVGFPATAYDLPGDASGYLVTDVNDGWLTMVNGLSQLSWSGFVCWDSVTGEGSGSGSFPIMQWSDNGSTNFGFHIGVYNDRDFVVAARARPGDAYQSGRRARNLQDGQQYHFAISIDLAGNTIQAWEDGLFIMNESVSFAASTFQFTFTTHDGGVGGPGGFLSLPGYFMDGYVVWTGFWDTVLTQTEADALATGVRPGTVLPANCISELLLDPAITQLSDSVGTWPQRNAGSVLSTRPTVAP